MPSAMLLAHIELWVAELEREVQAFEDAVEEVEEMLDEAGDSEVSRDSSARGTDGQSCSEQSLSRLDGALQSANHFAELVCAANATLLDALDAAQQIMRNEGVAQPLEQAAHDGEQPSSNGAQPAREGVTVPRRVIKAKFVLPDWATSSQQTDAPATPPLSSLGLEPLSPGALILQGRYHITRLLHARPRVNLYLGYRQPTDGQQDQAEQVSPVLVAIRELVLTGLSPAEQQLIEQAAFEEFVAPTMFGSPRLPGVGDRVSIERERHYLVMQLRPTRGAQQAVAVPLAELLLAHRQWPGWLNVETALEWGVQLCRIVARLHRMGCVIGDLDPATILVDNGAVSHWAPVLLVSWPPALQFWPSSTTHDNITKIFPIATTTPAHPGTVFVAPEMARGRCDERSDIYTLGAILYLLFTRYAPVSSALRQVSEGKPGESGPLTARQGMLLVPPHLLNNRISPRLEAILIGALALNPADRYPTAFALVEALESIDPLIDFADPFAAQTRHAHSSSIITKVLQWVKRELEE